MDWKYTAYRGVTLHDHGITEWIFGKDTMIIFENGFDVFADCPQNATGRHKHTGKSAVMLENAVFVSGTLSLGEDEAHLSCGKLRDLYLEVLEMKQFPDSVTLACDAWQNGGDAGFCILEFKCEGIKFFWNEFTEDAWFQD